RSRKAGGVTAKNLRECLKRIEKFHFLYTAITSSRASGISNKYAAYAKNLFKKGDNNKKNGLVRDLTFKDKFPTLEEFKEKFQEILFYDKDKTDKKIVRYVLTQIDKYLKPADGRSINYNEMTIEHIISQENSSLGKNIGKMGNLILVDKKTQERLQTKPLVDKISILHKKGFDKDKFFLSPEYEGEAWIKHRTDELANFVYKVFTN
ncbi:MAG: DUF1524 domain-containing protein, partial [Candidatus Brocadiia bacterium]